MNDLEDLIDWFRDAEHRMAEMGAASATPEIIRKQLKDQRLFNEDIGSQKSRLRDAIQGAKKLVKEFSQSGQDTRDIENKIEVCPLLTTDDNHYKIIFVLNFDHL